MWVLLLSVAGAVLMRSHDPASPGCSMAIHQPARCPEPQLQQRSVTALALPGLSRQSHSSCLHWCCSKPCSTSVPYLLWTVAQWIAGALLQVNASSETISSLLSDNQGLQQVSRQALFNFWRKQEKKKTTIHCLHSISSYISFTIHVAHAVIAEFPLG